ncbi:putative ATP-dependent DNA helicase HFM1 [Lonchura striata]|uniref:ATP-dependent DNA helicase HFM1 n=1 Tax=Lonchura striata TaxID=40157 RepID=A0A218VFA2_9PASE|nr:putative ATP-dependent DNA helicase HFM1 [Lonchura striata domestica]
MFNSADMVFSLDNLFYEKPDMRQSLGERDKISAQRENLKVVSSFLSFDENKRVVDFSQQWQNKAFSENSDDESVHSTLRKRNYRKKIGNFEGCYRNTYPSTQFRSIFKEFPYFNYAQSKALDDVSMEHKLQLQLLYTDRNFVICAPTGSGKTVMFELAITRLLMEAPLPWLNIKVVYMAPIKALCSQRFDDWKEKFGPIGLTCKELTGDTLMDDLFEIHHADIIITTPEKWDSMTRRWRDNSIVQLVRLFLIDEVRKRMRIYSVHVIKDESRGATLEVVVSRMKTIQSSLWRLLEKHDTVPPLRFVAVSATIPNTQDVRIAEWLSDSFSSGLDKVGIEAKLQVELLGYTFIQFDDVLSGVYMDKITMISNCTEFVDVKLRTNEKKILNTLNKDKDKITISIKLVYMFFTGVSLSNAMVNAGLTSFKKIEDINARELELVTYYFILNRHPPFGNQIKESVLHLPKYELEIEQVHYFIFILCFYAGIIKLKSKDSVLLKTGNWMKKIEVKRALKSEDISINLISSDYVGLDIQRAYTAFYLTPKPEGHKVVTNQKLKAESTLDICYGSPQNLPTAKADTGGRSKQEIAYKKYGNRECNHRCKNKDVCGHDCYKSRYCFSDALNVDFELRDDIWDDIDDDKLVFASNFVNRELDFFLMMKPMMSGPLLEYLMVFCKTCKQNTL